MSIELFAIGSSGLALAAIVIMVITRQDISDLSVAPLDSQKTGENGKRDA